jgi:hypothetical protein
MRREIAYNQLAFSLGISGGGGSILITVYRSALERYMADGACSKSLGIMFTESESRPLQQVLASSMDNDIQTLGYFAETFHNEGKIQIAVQLFQFLTLLCPSHIPTPIPICTLRNPFWNSTLIRGYRSMTSSSIFFRTIR